MIAPSAYRQALEKAWKARPTGEEALRIFHGPGEGIGVLQNLALDRFGRHVWITRWESQSSENSWAAVNSVLQEFFSAHGFISAVELVRPETGVPEEPHAFFGTPPKEPFEIREGRAKYWIRFQGARHPGLFLDHRPLRDWLCTHTSGKRVLNTFAYTGSLSVAAALGGASEVTSLDLSNPITQWSKENWNLNALPESSGRFIAGDVFEWLPKLKKKHAYDCVILDPPSFSRGKKGAMFSTSKDLLRLHEAALSVMNPEGGILITSINSANVSLRQYETEVRQACKNLGWIWKETIQEIHLPPTFPVKMAVDSYLKGWVIRLEPRRGTTR